MRYLLYSGVHYPEAYDPMPISGLFHWRRIFDGDIGIPPPDKIMEYDAIHLNMTSNAEHLPLKIRKVIGWGRAPKLIVNVDYAVQLWANQFSDASFLLDMLDMADFIFHVEERAADALTIALGREVCFIPHPVDVDTIKAFSVGERDPVIMSFVHRYDSQWLGPWLVSRDLGMQTVGMLANTTPPEFVVRGMQQSFDMVQGYVPYAQFLPMLARAYAAVESYGISSYGRVSAECAALGVPCVGANIVGSIKQCFPALATGVQDYRRQRQLLTDLVRDTNFWRACVEEGKRRVKFYGYEQSRRRMLEALRSAGVYSPSADELDPPKVALPDRIGEGGVAL